MQSHSSYDLSYAQNVENLVLTGAADINGTGNELNNVITGNAGNNNLYGLAGNDTLTGGAYYDNMYGGIGDDLYIIAEDVSVYGYNADRVIEYANEGIDTVQSHSSYDLSYNANVENLILTGVGNINGSGNELNNVIAGNVGNNLLQGLNGNDSLYGGDGYDIYSFGDNWGQDFVSDSSGLDLIHFSNLSAVDADLTISGNDLIITQRNTTNQVTLENHFSVNDNHMYSILFSDNSSKFFYGTENADTLVGMTGNDYMEGLEDNDFIQGLAGNDTLSGGIGADTLEGSIGNDFYIVDNTSDVIVELADEGFDMVSSNVSYTLGDDIEGISLRGTSNINAAGNELDNYIQGNDGNNILSGLSGDDIYTVSNNWGQDIISDSSGTDTILFASVSGSPVTSTDLAIFMDASNNLILDDGANSIFIQDQVNNTIERIEISDGYLTDSDINQLIQDMNTYATNNSISLTSVDDVAANADLMNIVAGAWNSY